MSCWLLADIILLLATVPCAILVLRSLGLGDWAVAVKTNGIIAALALFMLAHVIRSPSFCDLAVTLSLLSVPTGLTLARLFARWFLH